MIALFCGLAWATSAYDPTTYEARFEGQEVWSQDGERQLWSAIERHRDPEARLFTQEEFNPLTEWPATSTYSPWIADLFGSQRPSSDSFLLHIAKNEPTATGTPVLLIPGAGDNGSRGFILLQAYLDQQDHRPVFAITFAHPHGDVLQQAEAIADAVARIREITGAPQVDLVAHSKGGIAAAVYVSHGAGADWDRPDYERYGTAYRSDVRKLVLLGTPLGGIDAAYRWSSMNLLLLDPATAMGPSAWARYYPYTTGAPAFVTDLAEQDFLPDDGDLFPGQRQLLARQPDYPLPGSLPWLGSYAVQFDWYTTYEGGLGYYSFSDGIDAAIDAGGRLIERLAARGADPGVRIYLLAGASPLMPNSTDAYLAELYGQAFIDMATAGTDAWAALLAHVVGDGLASFGYAQSDVQGLVQGKMLLGEITGPSDGLVFVSSALDTAALTARGATVVQADSVEVSHLDLLIASDEIGQQLIDYAATDPLEYGWCEALGQRYIDANPIGWVRLALSEDPVDTGDDTGIPEDDTGVPEDDTGTDDSADTGEPAPGGKTSRCSSLEPASGGLALLLALGALTRRRRA